MSSGPGGVIGTNSGNLTVESAGNMVLSPDGGGGILTIETAPDSSTVTGINFANQAYTATVEAITGYVQMHVAGVNTLFLVNRGS